MIKLAVTAASGQLGGAILKEAIDKIGQKNIIGVARTPVKAKYLGVDIRKGDYNNKANFVHALKGVDTVLLVSGMDEPDKRVLQHRNIIEAAKQNGVRKIVYTSIFGIPGGTSFDAIIESNRKTEEEIKKSGMQWVIGRNGLYIEPDIEYINRYIAEGKITNSAGEGKCGYTSRGELAYAYIKMVLNDDRNGKTYNLFGQPISQQELVENINTVYGTNIIYNPVSPKVYLKDRTEAHGEFLGAIICGIYNNIKEGGFNQKPQYKEATGREHLSCIELIKSLKEIL